MVHGTRLFLKNIRRCLAYYVTYEYDVRLASELKGQQHCSYSVHVTLCNTLCARERPKKAPWCLDSGQWLECQLLLPGGTILTSKTVSTRKLQHQMNGIASVVIVLVISVKPHSGRGHPVRVSWCEVASVTHWKEVVAFVGFRGQASRESEPDLVQSECRTSILIIISDYWTMHW